MRRLWVYWRPCRQIIKKEELWERGVDIKDHKCTQLPTDEFIIGDLREPFVCQRMMDRSFVEVYQLALTRVVHGISLQEYMTLMSYITL
jgi:hypothetical protein